MGLLDGLEVACFDLFDTLIRIDREKLPEVTWNGESVRSTIPILHERIFEPRGVSRDDLAAALRSLWSEVRAELKDEGGCEDRAFAEIPAVEKYRRLARRLELGDEREIEGLALEVAETHHATLISAAVPMEGAAEVLTAVRARGVPTALVSNWDHAAAGPAMLEHTGLTQLLDRVVISEAVGVRKPHARIFERALAPFDADPAAALHVGDLARSDAWGAGRLGFRTVWLNPSGGPYPEPEHPPTLTVSRLADLLEHL